MNTKKDSKLKILFLLTLSLMLCAAGVTPAFASAPAVYVNEERVAFTAQSGQPFNDEQSRMQVPLRITMETYGCKTTWSEAEKTAVLEKDGTTVKVPIGKRYILINGREQKTDTEALIKDGRTYLPIRPVLEAFGAAVAWDEAENAVKISAQGNNMADVQPIADTIQVHFIDVGQADAILIDSKDVEVLIDGGNNKDGEAVVSYIRDYVDGKLEHIIATHPDADHIGGLDTVIAAFDVSNITDSGCTKATKTYEDYWAAATAEQNCNIIYDADMVIDLGGGAELTVIETGDGYADANDNSVVSRLTYGDISLLLTGDMEKTAESASMSKFTASTVLKAGHHGSATSSSQEFLDIVKPEYVIISAGEGNSYKHPHKAVLERFFASGATVYGTFRSGTIVMTTDGKDIAFNTSDPVIITDAGDIAA